MSGDERVKWSFPLPVQETAMIPPSQWFEDFQKNMSDLLAKTPAADIERTMKAFMTQTFARMDLVTREEFDVQTELLSRALQRVDTLEARIRTLEQPGDGATQVDKPE
jgi:BMFP domain-containing protein YqiC